MKFLLTLILSSTFLLSIAQTYTWQRMYGDTDRESAEAIVQLPDGDYVFVGATQSATSDSSQILLCKTDRVGNAKWRHLMATEGNSAGYDLQIIPNEGLIIAGMVADTFGRADMYVAKVDFGGNLIWQRTYGGDLNDVATSIKPTADGGFILTGYSETEEEGEELALIKIDQNGAIQWQTQYGGVLNERGEEVIITADGGYAVTGFTESFGEGQRDLFLIRTDFVGNERWLKTYGNRNNQTGYSLIQNVEGGFVIAGTSEFSSYYPADLYLMGTDKDGAELWSNSYGGDARVDGFSLDAVGEEGYIIAGSRSTFFGFYPSDFYLFRIDNQGIKLWDRAFPNEFPATARSIVSTQDGGYIIAGYAQPTEDENTQDAQLIKTDALGNIDTTFQAVIENNSPLACFGDTDGQADIWVTGGQYPYAYDWAQLETDTFNIDNLAAATYEVTVTDRNGRQMVKQTTITTPDELQLTPDMMATTSCPESLDGVARVIPTGGTAPFGYLWSNGNTTAVDSNLVAGTYRVTVVDVNACQATTEFEVSSASTMTVEITEQRNASCGDTNDGELRIDVSGGNAPFTYQLGENMLNEPVFTNLAAGDYTLIVRDANGCRVTREFSIEELADAAPTASFTQQITDLSVAFSANLVAADSVRWDFGNGNFASEISPIYVYPQGGNYTVCLTAMNACGNTTACNEIALLDCNDAVIDTDFTATSSDTTVQFTNTSVGMTENFRWRFGDGGSSRQENPAYTYATTGSYEVCLTARNACGSYTFCDSVRVELNSDVIIDVAGEIQMIDGQTMEDVEVSCGGLIDTTASDGKYSLQTNARANCAITPFKADSHRNGVTTFDIVLTQKHILRIEPFTSPYQMIAADVNNSGTITSFDLVLMRKLVLNLNEEFADVPAWRFVPKDYEFVEGEFAGFPENVPLNNVNASRSDIDFVGVKRGDVNNSAVPNLQTDPIERSTTISPLSIENQSFVANQIIHIPVKFAEATSGFQLAFQLSDAVELLDITPVVLNNFDKNNFNKDGQEVAIAWWATDAPTPANETLFNLKLRTKRAGQIADVIQLNNHPLTAELYTSDLESTDVELQFTESNSDLNVLLSPNPAANFIQLHWLNLPQGDIKVQLLQPTGQVIKTWQTAIHQLNISELTSGIYFLIIENNGQRNVQRLIKK